MIVKYKTQWQNSLENPYRFFFPFAFFGVLLGLGIIFFPLGQNIIFWHREILITLFLFPIANGFLYTAVPRFFNSYYAKNREIFFTLFLLILLFVFAILKKTNYYIFIKFFYILQITIFIIERFWNKKSATPLFTPFIFVSLFSAILGTIFQILYLFYPVSIFYLLFYNLYYYATFMILLFGVGIKFFPMLTLTTPLSEERKYQILSKKLYSSIKFWYFFSFLFLFTFLLEFHFIKIALWIRAFLVLFLAYEGWYIFFPSQRKGIYTFFIKLFLYTIVISHFIFPFFPEFKQHLYHVIFVNGYLGLVLIVVGRVLISHERLDLNLEVKSRILGFIFGLIFLAFGTRVTAFLIQKSYENHLKYASLTALIGIIMYIIFFLVKILKRVNQSKK